MEQQPELKHSSTLPVGDSDAAGAHQSTEPAGEASSSSSSSSNSSSSASVLQLPTADTHDLVYCCKRCRRPLFTPDHLTDHEAGRHAFTYRRQAKERGHATSAGGGADDSSAAAAASNCTSYFLVDALQWMEVRIG